MKCQHGGCQHDAAFRVVGFDYYSWGLEHSKEERFACSFHLHVMIRPTYEWPCIQVEPYVSEPEERTHRLTNESVR